MTTGARRVFASPSARIAIGLVIGQGLIFAALPVLTRLYSTDEIARSGVFLASIGIVGTAASLRIETLLPRAEEDQIPYLLRRAVIVLLVASFSAGVAYGVVTATVWEAGLFGLGALCLGGGALGLQLASRVNRLGSTAAAKATLGIGQVSTQITAGLIGVTRMGLLVGIAAGYASSAATQWIGVLRRRTNRSATTPYPRVWAEALPLTAAALLNVATVWMVLLFISYEFGSGPTADLTIAQRIVTLPAGLVIATLAPVLVARAGAAIRAGESGRSESLRLLRWLAIPSVAVLVVCLFTPSAAYSLVLGDEWAPVRNYVAALGPATATHVLVGPLSLVLIVQGRTRTQFIWDLSRTVTIAAVLIGVSQATSDPVATVLAGSLTLTGFYVINLALILRWQPPSVSQHARVP